MIVLLELMIILVDVAAMISLFTLLPGGYLSQGYLLSLDKRIYPEWLQNR